MPTYSYQCSACQHGFDQYQAFTDDSLTVCPACGEERLRKVFNNIGVSFNGTGFYRTDSRSDSGTKSKATDAAQPKSETASSSATPSTTSTAN